MDFNAIIAQAVEAQVKAATEEMKAQLLEVEKQRDKAMAEAVKLRENVTELGKENFTLRSMLEQKDGLDEIKKAYPAFKAHVEGLERDKLECQAKHSDPGTDKEIAKKLTDLSSKTAELVAYFRDGKLGPQKRVITAASVRRVEPVKSQ